MFTFRRPENLKFPTIYYTFKAKDKNSNEIVDYRVQDLPEEFFETALDFLENYFMPFEELAISRGVANDRAALDEFREFWIEILKERLSIGCFKNDELVGLNLLGVSSKDNPKRDINFKNEGVKDVWGVFYYITKQLNIFEEFKVDRYLSAYGLVCHPDYRGRGIATEILKARVPILKALSLTVTSTVFSGIGSQTAAKKAGYEEIYSIKYNDLKQVSPQFSFLNTKSEFIKILTLQIE